jgi:peroxiredoxin
MTKRIHSVSQTKVRELADKANPASRNHSATALPAGTLAPDFSLPSTPDRKVSLSELRGRPVVLVFYPADWSPVCSDQLGLYNELLPEFSDFDAQVIGISVDGIWCHLAFSKDRKLRTPLLADFEPKGTVARRYGVYDEKTGEAERALFVIDPMGVIRWSYVSPVGINPGADGILKALASLVQSRNKPATRESTRTTAKEEA